MEINHEAENLIKALGWEESRDKELISKFNKLVDESKEKNEENEESIKPSIFVEKLCKEFTQLELTYLFWGVLQDRANLMQRLNMFEQLMASSVAEGVQDTEG